MRLFIKGTSTNKLNFKIKMEKSNNVSCCTSTSNEKSNCCPPALKKGKGTKGKLGLGLLGLAVVLASLSAFKMETKAACSGDVSCEVLTLKDFDWIKTDKKVAFILLKGNDEAKNQKVAKEVKLVIDEINETEGSAYFQALESTSAEYDDLVKKENINEFPAIVVLGKHSKSSVLSGKINSIKLVRAYDLAAVTQPSCGPGQKTSCSPSQKASCCKKK